MHLNTIVGCHSIRQDQENVSDVLLFSSFPMSCNSVFKFNQIFKLFIVLLFLMFFSLQFTHLISKNSIEHIEVSKDKILPIKLNGRQRKAQLVFLHLSKVIQRLISIKSGWTLSIRFKPNFLRERFLMVEFLLLIEVLFHFFLRNFYCARFSAH